ncbi:hypothetical protein TB2_002418 [Malus domestica]
MIHKRSESSARILFREKSIEEAKAEICRKTEMGDGLWNRQQQQQQQHQLGPSGGVHKRPRSDYGNSSVAISHSFFL